MRLAFSKVPPRSSRYVEGKRVATYGETTQTRKVCVHCLRDPVERNWDHVFPESWYPDTTPPNLAKWQVPSCINCNKELGIESEFLIHVALCLDPKDPASRSIVQKALRALNPESAKTPSDGRARAGLSRRITSKLLQGHEIPTEGIFPSLGERWGRPRGTGIALTIPAESFRRITEKIVRGITYLECERYIEAPHTIEFFALDEEGARPLRALLEAHGTTLAREPGVIVRRAVVPDDGVSALYEIEFWKQFKTHAVVLDAS